MAPDPRDGARYVGSYSDRGVAELWYEHDNARERLDPPGRHSPTGYAWGYGGNGPADTALAVLAHAAARIDPAHGPAVADALHQEFKRQRIAALPMNAGWTMPAAEVDTWLAARGLQAGPQIEPEVVARQVMLDAAPVRQRLLAEPDVELPRSLPPRILDGDVEELTPFEARVACDIFGCTPDELWDRETADAVSMLHRAETWPAVPEPDGPDLGIGYDPLPR